MKITEENTVAEIVVQNIKTAHVFKKHGIDFCCGGGITVEKACSKNSVDYAILKKEIEAISNGLSKAYNYDEWELDFLIDHIINVHHSYVAESILTWRRAFHCYSRMLIKWQMFMGIITRKWLK